MVHVVEVLEHGADVAGPELADQKQRVLAEFLLQVIDELVGPALGKVLARVEPEAGQFELAHYPFAPVGHVGCHFGVRVVEVGEHEKVRVASLIAHAVGPMLVVTQDPENAGPVVARVVVRAGEVFPVVFLGGVFVSTAGKVETEPCFHLKGLADFLGAV